MWKGLPPNFKRMNEWLVGILYRDNMEDSVFERGCQKIATHQISISVRKLRVRGRTEFPEHLDSSEL